MSRYTADQWQGLEPRSTRLERQHSNPQGQCGCPFELHLTSQNIDRVIDDKSGATNVLKRRKVSAEIREKFSTTQEQFTEASWEQL